MIKGSKHSKETIEKLRKSMLGKKRSEEFKRNLSEKMRGKNSPMYGKKLTDETKQKLREKAIGRKPSAETIEKLKRLRSKELNPRWKGDKVGIRSALHEFVRKYKETPELCEVCNIKHSLDLANVTGIYARGFENWKYMCRKCHMTSDNRIENLMKARDLYHEKMKIEISKRICNICHERSKRWAIDTEGYICSKCYSIILYYRKKPIGDIQIK